jgi:hypothetical protein
MLYMAAVLAVLQVQYPAGPAWGTNSVTITIRNDAAEPREIAISWQTSNKSVGRGWGLDSTVTVPPGESTFTHGIIVPAFPGDVTHRLTLRDPAEQLVLWTGEKSWTFPFANDRTNPLEIPAKLREAIQLAHADYPALRVRRSGYLALYYLDGDSYVSSRAEGIFRERQSIYGDLSARLNPEFHEPVSIYLFPDADSKLAYTMHRGMGWAHGNLLVEIFNAKERIDPHHEMAHIVAGSIGNPPAMLDEGFAAWSQAGHVWDGHAVDAWAAGFAARGLLWPLARLFTFTEIGSDESRAPIAYPQSASVVNYLVATYGFEKFLAAYRTLKRGQDERNLAEFQRIFGRSIADVERDWLSSLKEAKPVPAAMLDEIVAKYRPSAKE